MERLVELVRTGGRALRGAALSAIAATASGAEGQFAPYFEDPMRMLKLLAPTEEEHLYLRARALDCIGHMGVAMGAAALEPHLMEVMRSALQGMLLGGGGAGGARPTAARPRRS